MGWIPRSKLQDGVWAKVTYLLGGVTETTGRGMGRRRPGRAQKQASLTSLTSGELGRQRGPQGKSSGRTETLGMDSPRHCGCSRCTGKARPNGLRAALRGWCWLLREKALLEQCTEMRSCIPRDMGRSFRTDVTATNTDSCQENN